MTPDYREFLARKAPRAHASGLQDVPAMHKQMKPHQRDATAFCLRQGRAGLFLDTGLGKTFCELEFAKYAAEATNGRALILTPLAVAKQIEREAQGLLYYAVSDALEQPERHCVEPVHGHRIRGCAIASRAPTFRRHRVEGELLSPSR